MRAAAYTLAFALFVGAPVWASEPLTLKELVRRARENDSRVRESHAELQRLRALQRQAFWAWFPKFESFVTVGGPTPEARNDGLGGPPLTEATKMYDLNFGKAGVMMRFEASAFLPLYTFGKLDALNAAAEKGVAVGEGLRERAKNEAAYQAAEAYFGYQLSRQAKDVLKDTRQRLDDAEKLIRELIDQESPQVTKMDLYKVQYFRSQLDAQLAQADSGRELALTGIRLLTGMPPEAPVEIAEEDLSPPEVTLKPFDAYLALANDHRPELSAINAGLAAREQEVRIKERMFYPDFGIAGGFRWMYTTSATRQLSPFAYDPYNDLSGGVALVARATFDIPVKSAELDASRAELAKLAAQKEQVQALVQLEVRQAYGALQDALARAAAQQDAEKSARRWATAAYAAFELGTSDTRELTDAFTALALASAEHVKALHDAQLGLDALSRAVGQDLRNPGAE